MPLYSYKCGCGHETRRWASPERFMEPTACEACGKQAPRDPLDVPGAGHRMRGEVRNIESLAAAVMPHEVGRASREAAELGLDVKFKPNGVAVFRDRNTKIKYLNAIGMRDNDEIRGGRTH